MGGTSLGGTAAGGFATGTDTASGGGAAAFSSLNRETSLSSRSRRSNKLLRNSNTRMIRRQSSNMAMMSIVGFAGFANRDNRLKIIGKIGIQKRPPLYFAASSRYTGQ